MTLICPNAIATILYIRYGMFLHFDRLNVDSMDRSAQTGGNVMTGVRAGNAFPPHRDLVALSVWAGPTRQRYLRAELIIGSMGVLHVGGMIQPIHSDEHSPLQFSHWT